MTSKHTANIWTRVLLLVLMGCAPTYAADPWACVGVSKVGQPQRWIDWLGRTPYCCMSGWLAFAWGDWYAYEHPTGLSVRMCTQSPGKEVYQTGYIWAYLDAYHEAKGGSGHPSYTSGPNAWSWRGCANGDYNRYYKALAKNCIKANAFRWTFALF